MRIFIFIMLIISTACFSAEVYKFKTASDEERFYSLIHEIRCPKCTSGSIASSNAPISEDLKSKVEELINSGYTDSEIKKYIKDRFGNDVLYEPEINNSTLILWFGPFIFLFLIFIGFSFRRRS